MSETGKKEQRLALLLEVSRDFALQQIADGHRLIPFAARVGTDGEIEFVRLAEEDSEEPLEEIYARTQAALREQAAAAELLAAAMVASVAVEHPQEMDGCEQAIHVHVEEPGYSRIVLAPYGFVEPEEVGGVGRITEGKMVPVDAPAVIFQA